MISLLSPDEVEAMLRRHSVGRLACAVNDQPYIVPIDYVYEDGFVYAYSALGRKITIMRAQPRICFEIDEITGFAGWRSVIAEGCYEEVRDAAKLANVLPRLSNLRGDLPPRTLSGSASRPVVVFRLRLTAKSGRMERQEV